MRIEEVALVVRRRVSYMGGTVSGSTQAAVCLAGIVAKGSLSLSKLQFPPLFSAALRTDRDHYNIIITFIASAGQLSTKTAGNRNKLGGTDPLLYLAQVFISSCDRTAGWLSASAATRL